MRTAVKEAMPPFPLRQRSKALLNDDAYYDFCQENPDIRFERTPKGEIVVVPPAGGESDFRTLDIAAQLKNWTRRKRTGAAFGCSTELILPTRAALSPDAAWVSSGRIEVLTPEQRPKFLKVIPEFIVEVMSPSDTLRAAQGKVNQWMAGGVDLGWWIDGDHQAVYVYRRGQAKPEKHVGVQRLAGEGPVAGFVLQLREIWRGL